jgi:hypothetical protein
MVPRFQKTMLPMLLAKPLVPILAAECQHDGTHRPGSNASRTSAARAMRLLAIEQQPPQRGQTHMHMQVIGAHA